MRVSREEMEQSHTRIVESAARLLRERGIENTSVAGVMNEAGLTHGGFYRHFNTKDELLETAVEQAFADVERWLDARFEKSGRGAAILDYHANYISKRHVDQPGKGCPAAALACDIGRSSASLKTVFGAGVKRLIAKLACGMRGAEERRKAKAARRFAMLVGAVMIARASDPETADLMLSSCKMEENDL
jgi:TetR/AcrR family transcriptional regulator, transcriptional repressor for nem operon